MMAFPVIQSADTKTGVVSTDSTTWTLDVPSNLAVGDVILAFVVADTDANNPDLTGPSGWYLEPGGGGLNSCDTYVLGTTVWGGEASTFDVTWTEAQKGAWIVLRITGAFGIKQNSTYNRGIAYVMGYNNAVPDPGSCNPSSWDVEDTLWIAFCGVSGGYSVTGYPLSDGQLSAGPSGADGAQAAMCWVNSASSSYDVGAWTLSGGTGIPPVVAIRPYPAAPTFVEAAGGATDAGGAWSYTSTETSHHPASVWVFQALEDGVTEGGVECTGASNIKSLSGSANSWTSIASGLSALPVGNPSVAQQYLYIGRANGAGAPTASGTNSTSNDLYMRMYEFAGVSDGTALADVIENDTGNLSNGVGTSNTASDTAVVTNGPNRLALNFVAVNDDNAIATFSGQTGGTWVESYEYAESSGTDGAIQLQYATMASAGTIDGGTASITVSDAWGVVGFALIGTTVAETRVPRLSPYLQLLAH